MQSFSIEEPLVERRGAQRSTVTTFVFAVLCVFGVACLCGNALAPVGFALTPAVLPSARTAPGVAPAVAPSTWSSPVAAASPRAADPQLVVHLDAADVLAFEDDVLGVRAAPPAFDQAAAQDPQSTYERMATGAPWQFSGSSGAAGPSRARAPTMGIAERAIAGATQGAVGAVIAAILSAFTEPMVNRVLVQRMSLMESVKQTDVKKSMNFFKTTLPTNFLKFPLFEAVNAVLEVMPISGAAKGAITGLAFTTITLPVTNYRFCKSMGFTIDKEALFKAYLPTVGRDIAYGIARNFLRAALFTSFAAQAATASGRSLLLFPIVFGACVLSSPGNELRGYYLQPKDKRLGFKEFFKPINYVRSTITGACIMGIALMSGSALTPAFERLLKSF